MTSSQPSPTACAPRGAGSDGTCKFLLVDKELIDFADRLYARGKSHDRTQADRLDRYRNLEPESAAVLRVLAMGARPARMLELGTSNGYSTLFLASVAAETGAEFVSVDIDGARSAAARENLAEVGLDSAVTLQTEDASLTLSSSPDQSWDLIFLDAERSAYASYWADLLRTMTPQALLIVDNILSHPDDVTEFRGLVDNDARVIDALIPVGAGLLLVTKRPL